jgi:hypothetical protein
VIRGITTQPLFCSPIFGEFAQAVERASVSPELRRQKQRITAANPRQNSNEQPRISGIFTTIFGAPSALTAPAAAVSDGHLSACSGAQMGVNRASISRMPDQTTLYRDCQVKNANT